MAIDPFRVRPADALLPVGVSAETEVSQKRRENSKTYQIAPSQFNLSSAMGSVHYKDNYFDDSSPWNEIDLSIDNQGDVATAPYDINIFTDRIGYTYTSKRNGYITIELLEVGNTPVDNNRFTVRREGNQLFWDNVVEGMDLKIILAPLKAEVFKQLTNDVTPRQLKWRVQEDISPEAVKIVRIILGADANGDNLEIVTNVSNQGTGTRENEIAYRRFDFEEIWTGRVSRRISDATRQKAWFDDPAYPVLIDQTANENIVANVDDGYENNSASPWLLSTTFAGGNNWVFGYYAGGTVLADGGVRFQTLGVPQGATITASTLTLRVSTINSGGGYDPAAIIFADDVDDAATWANNSRPSQITQTTASTNLTVTATGDTAAGITAIVQEIVSRGGWSSGNDIRFGIINNVATAMGNNAFAYIYDYNQGQTLAARLEVVYTVPGQAWPSFMRHPRTNVLLRM